MFVSILVLTAGCLVTFLWGCYFDEQNEVRINHE